MPTVTVMRAGGEDLLRRYWWAVLLLILGIGGWVSLPLMEGRWEGGASSGLRGQGDEQSLDSLDAARDPSGAPGMPVPPVVGAGAYRRSNSADSTQTSSLYQPAGSVLAGGSPAAGAEGSGSLGAALKNLARSGKKPGDQGWGGAAARSGFSRPKASFGAMSGLAGASGGGGGSFAGWGTGVTAFGSGRSNPGEAATTGPAGNAPMNPPRIRRGANQALNALRGAEAKAGLAAATAELARASGLGGQSYDATGSKAALSPDRSAAGAVVGDLDSVPDNLKVNDPALDQREFQVPEIDGKKDDRAMKELEFQKQVEMMIIQAAIGGVMGPVFGGFGAGVAGMMGLQPPSGLSHYEKQKLQREILGGL